MHLLVEAIQAVVVVALLALLLRERRRARGERILRSAEERFHRMIDRAPVMIWTARPDTTLDYLNQHCVVFTGLPIEKLRDEGWLDAVHPEDREYCMGIYGPAIEARQPFLVEYRVRHADGDYRWLLATGVPRYEPDGSFAGFIGCDVDVTERRRGEIEVQQLAGRLLTAHEDERRHLARELHDDVTQRLARLAIDAARLGRDEEDGGLATAMRDDLARLSEDVHALSYRLHPSVLDDLGLVEALRAECDRIARNGTLRVVIDARGVPNPLPAEASLCLYRVAQEALSNVTRHAHASAVSLQLSPCGEGLQIAVTDNGAGFDPAARNTHHSLGLASMRERVRLVDGKLDIASGPGQGTTVTAWVPA